MMGSHPRRALQEHAALSAQEFSDLVRSHSHLSGSLAGNLETWLTDPGTVGRYLELAPWPLSGENRLIEIGCYQASVGYYFRQGWKEVLGVFKEPGEGTRVETYGDGRGSTVRLVQADIEFERVDAPDEWADAVLMMEVFEHFAVDPMHALWEVNRVLKPGGRLVISTPNATSSRLLWQILNGRAPLTGFEFTGYTTNRHNRLYDALELRAILEQAGFEVEECFSRTYPGQKNSNATGRIFVFLLRALDSLAQLAAPTGRRRERGHFLCARATKRSSPLERYPTGLYFDPKEWPGMAEERARRLKGG